MRSNDLGSQSRRIFVLLRLKLLFLCFCSILLCSGCFWFTSRARGDELEAEVSTLHKQVVDLERQVMSDREEYTALIQKAEKDMVELEAILNRATKAAGEYAADTVGFREELAKAEGAIAELRQDLVKMSSLAVQREDSIRDRMEVIAAKVGLDPPLDATQIPRDRGKHLEAANKAYGGKQYGKARSLYRAFVERYPTDAMVDDVQLKVGRAYAAENRHAQALTALNVIVDRYPETNLMGETLYSMAYSLYKMRSCNDSITLLQAVIKRYKSQKGLQNRAKNTLREVSRSKRRGCQP